jgi:hypothetical protein
MLKISADQSASLSETAEERFARRVEAHLVECCEDAMPEAREARGAHTRRCIDAARDTGLTWQSTIAEFARLLTLREAGGRVVHPARLAGGSPDIADAVFAEEMRRTEIIGNR